MVTPQIGPGMGWAGYPGERYTPYDPFYMETGRGALENLAMPFEQFAQPAMDLFHSRVAPEVMARYAGQDVAASGGAALGLGRAGGEMINQAFSDWVQTQQALPALASGFAPFAHGVADQPRAEAERAWMEAQDFASPYLALGQSFIPGSGSYAENIASPGQQSFLQSMAPGIGTALAMAPFITGGI